MAAASALSRVAFECALTSTSSRPCERALTGTSSRPFLAAVPGQRWRALKVTDSSASRRGSRARRTTTPVAKGALPVNVDAPPSELVRTLLTLVDGTDRGTQIDEPEKRAVEEVVAKLETLCIPEPLSSPLLFGDWEVAYSSNPTAPGGYYRSMVGRALLRTRDMVQRIAPPDAITNTVAFAALGLLDGRVTLQGKLEVLDERWVEVTFEAPRVEVGALDVQYGGRSSVRLAVLYLDEAVRIGRGSRGSLFVFKRRA